MIFNPKEMLGILDLRMIEYYKIKEGILQQNLSNYCIFESADILCEQFNKCINTMKKGNEEMNDKYPWLDDEKGNVSDREIFEKYLDLKNNVC